MEDPAPEVTSRISCLLGEPVTHRLYGGNSQKRNINPDCQDWALVAVGSMDDRRFWVWSNLEWRLCQAHIGASGRPMPVQDLTEVQCRLIMAALGWKGSE